MGMCAEILAVGPYSERVAQVLDYSPDIYARTREGAVITVMLFGMVEGTALSTELAGLFGIADPWNFDEHMVVPERIYIAGLQKLCKRYPDYQRDVHATEVLRNAGFAFHFRPEG